MSTDYASTVVSLVAVDGRVLSGVLVSSASASAGLSAALSGDVVAPLTPLLGEDVVLIDRYPASTLTWVDVATGSVRAQLNVGTGFAANPQDYIEANGLAFVSRYETNSSPGANEHDGGGDLLVIDPEVPTIVDSIPLEEAMKDAPSFDPHPGVMLRLDEDILVLLSAHDAGYQDSTASRIALVDPVDRRIKDVRVLDGLHGCTGMTRRAIWGTERAVIAVVCSGRFEGNLHPSVEESGIILFDAELTEVARYSAMDLLGEPLGSSIAFDGDGILVSTLGEITENGVFTPDRLLSVPLDHGTPAVLLESTHSVGAIGHVRCLDSLTSLPEAPGCGSCYVADADRGQLHRVAEGGVLDSITIANGVGLPPRYLGRF